ncbi:hypothetical protein A3C89_00965 [Candidatus Kaiserbacteria bacterium RIFCSPHIGHO2_02_FULL_50_50]|uniref:Uncharacterized protein n=1 Tax=Candidatus Kaiserbacteria bacterium RIFCSPHIGHO2_02_FULL_50_50 TaxID=1798492 RepID=A0A1F6DDL0_9BACT|nr:MAG: hypothetical protein A3C89_00965 [Candidatus Kaiserbacteria bacterium RIFCSPHIGHO2_02_FULL_50_50]OGG89294.1 MAG: hypothetical protein A3G62_01445 [Candidatus Kaiserbacteria bacterium RIFCSPLOWO2_12_FULL_50_10]
MKIPTKNFTKEDCRDMSETLMTVLDTMHEPLHVKRFLFDVLTENELFMISRRLLIASMLTHGVSHDDISSTLKVGYGNIARIQKLLTNGSRSLPIAVAAMNVSAEAKAEKYAKMQPVAPGSLEWFKRMYPLHFLLVPTFRK